MRTILPHQQIKEDFVRVSVRVRELLRKIYRSLQKMDDLTKKALKIGLIGGIIAGFILLEFHFPFFSQYLFQQ